MKIFTFGNGEREWSLDENQVKSGGFTTFDELRRVEQDGVVLAVDEGNVTRYVRTKWGLPL